MGYGSQSRGTGARTEAEGWDRSEEVVDRGASADTAIYPGRKEAPYGLRNPSRSRAKAR